MFDASAQPTYFIFEQTNLIILGSKTSSWWAAFRHPSDRDDVRPVALSLLLSLETAGRWTVRGFSLFEHDLLREYADSFRGRTAPPEEIWHRSPSSLTL